MGNMSTCTAVLFEVGQLRGAAVVDGGEARKRTKQTKEKRKKGKETRAEEEALVMERSGGGKVSRRRGNSA